jgi:hypothetical protein
MSTSAQDTASVQPSLGPSERLSIINALMAQDSIEIRDRQEAVFRLTYSVVPGLVGIAAFRVGHSDYKTVLLIAQIGVLAIYVVAFVLFRRWLAQSRACLQIREEFYKDPRLLYSEPFAPIRPIEERDRVTRFEDNALWLPFIVTLLCGLVLLAYMIVKA